MNLTNEVLNKVARDYAQNFDRYVLCSPTVKIDWKKIEEEEQARLNMASLEREPEVMKVLRLLATGPQRYDVFGLPEKWYWESPAGEINPRQEALFRAKSQGWVGTDEHRWFFLTAQGVQIALLFGILQ